MSDFLQPTLVACHRRLGADGAGPWVYAYSLLAFSVEGDGGEHAHFCLAVRRYPLPSGGTSQAGLFQVSRPFYSRAQEALALFERIAFAREAVSPYHVDDLVEDWLGEPVVRSWGAAGPVEPQVLDVLEAADHGFGRASLAAGGE